MRRRRMFRRARSRRSSGLTSSPAAKAGGFPSQPGLQRNFRPAEMRRLTLHRAANAALHVLGGAPARLNQSTAQYVLGRVDVRVRLIPAFDAMEDRLAITVPLGDMPAFMASRTRTPRFRPGRRCRDPAASMRHVPSSRALSSHAPPGHRRTAGSMNSRRGTGPRVLSRTMRIAAATVRHGRPVLAASSVALMPVLCASARRSNCSSFNGCEYFTLFPSPAAG